MNKLQATTFDWTLLPSTRYQGSKRKLIPWIYRHLAALSFDTVLDVFGGSASVSYMFKVMGKGVTYNDTLRWNHLVGLALIENSSQILDSADLRTLLSSTASQHRGFISKTFRGQYFTDRENIWLDAIMERMSRFSEAPGANKYKVALAYYALFQSCLAKRPFNLFHRANLNLRLADVSRSFGNKSTWDKPFKDHFTKYAEEANRSLISGSRTCRAINFSAEAIPFERVDLVYLDPPYLKAKGSNETSNYHRCYHFLEGMANFMDWQRSINLDSNKLKFEPSTPNAWIDPATNLKAFLNLFDKYEESIFVISYKQNGTPCIQTLVRHLKRRGKKVRVVSTEYRYALNARNGIANPNRECLIIAE